MKTTAKIFQIIIWSTLTLVGSNLDAAKEPLCDGLGSYSRKITTDSPEAQRYFNDGLGFVHGFNHRAAIRAFQKAAELDPERAMAHGASRLRVVRISIFPPFRHRLRSWPGNKSALALENTANASPVERALIDALARRYANPQPENRSADRAYADANAKVWNMFPNECGRKGGLFVEANNRTRACGITGYCRGQPVTRK